MVELRHERIVIGDLGPVLLEKTEDIEGGRFPHVVDVPLVGDPEQQDRGSVDGLLPPVQGFSDLADDEIRHLGVDLGRQLDEARLVVQCPHLPREVVRIDGDAVTPEPRSGRELHEPERLRGGGVDHFPHVDAEAIGDQRRLVHQADVHRSEGVLQDLRELRRFGRRDADDRIQEPLVELGRRRRARRRDSANHLRRVLRRPHLVARVDPLGREGEVEVLADLQTGLLERGQEHLAGRARVRRGLEDHELTRAQRGADRGRRGEDERDVRVTRLGEGGRHADRDDVALGEPGHVRRRLQQSGVAQRGDLGLLHVLDVGATVVDGRDHVFLDVEAERGDSGLPRLDRQRQPDVTESDDAELGYRGGFLTHSL